MKVPSANPAPLKLIRSSLLALVVLLSGAGIVLTAAQALAQSTATYYVDCVSGNDNNPGTSPASAWKSMAKANSAPLQPGDKLLFIRGCTWKGPLRAAWTGTALQPITIGAYGAGNLPKIQDSYSGNVQISGSYQTIEYLETTLTSPPNPDPNCNNQPVAWKVGFAFGANSAYNTVQYAKATKLAVGVYLDYTSHHNKVVDNELTGNNVVWQLSQTQALGAMGILLHGDYQEIARNTFADNRTICTYNGIVESNSIELYGARYANIHHNVSYNDRVFSELGSSAAYPSNDNVYAYNLHVVSPMQSQSGSRFLVTRGAGNPNGPIWRTKAYNNTVYLTGPDSKGIACQNCGTDVLLVKNNIFWVDREPISADGPFVEEYNVYWSTLGNPLLNFTQSQTSRVADPAFVDVAAQNFRLQSTSPARQAGTLESVSVGYTVDLDLVSVPQGGTVDSGAYEFVESGAPTPEPDPSPIASCSISLDDGALYTSSSSVRIKANVSGATQMMVSNDAGFPGANWEPYQTEYDWTLRDTEGRIATLLVYARFADAAQTLLCGPSHLSDDIIYDPVAPTVSVAIATQGSAATESAQAMSESAILVDIAAQDQDNGSGVSHMQVSLEATFDDSPWQPFTSTTTISATPGQTIYVRVQDGAGNISPTASVTVPEPGDTGQHLSLPYVSR